MNENPILTILIPAFNEALRLPDTLRKIHDFCKSSLTDSYEILVVDDGSTDETIRLLQTIPVPNLTLHGYDINRGKGHALRYGMQLAKGRYIVFMDADLSTPIEELNKFLPPLKEGNHVVIGTRKGREARILKHQPLWRESMGRVFTSLSNWILGLSFSDFTCGFKGFQADAGKDIFSRQKIDGWAYDSEILFLAKRAGYRISEIPVTWINSADSKVQPARAAFSSLLGLLQIRWNWHSGKYKRSDRKEPLETVTLGRERGTK